MYWDISTNIRQCFHILVFFFISYNSFYEFGKVVIYVAKQGHFSENPTQDQRGSNPERMHDWRGSQAMRHVPLVINMLVCDFFPYDGCRAPMFFI